MSYGAGSSPDDPFPVVRYARLPPGNGYPSFSMRWPAKAITPVRRQCAERVRSATRAFLGGTTWRSCAHRPHLVVRACARSRSGGTGHRANPRRTSSLVVDPLGLRQNVDRHLLDACRFPFPGYAFPGSKLVAPRGDSAGLVWALTELIIGVPAAHQELVRPPQRVRRQRKLDAAGGHRIRPARA